MQSRASLGQTIPRPSGAAEALGPADGRPNRFAFSLLVLFALLLPFEAPLFRIGPLQITTVELALYALLAAWGVSSAWNVLRDRTVLQTLVGGLLAEPLTSTAILWVTVLFASAAAAPSYRAAAFKYALRSTRGVLAFLATRTLARTPVAIRRVLLALVTGAIVSATTALIDSLVPGSAAVWGLFREGSFDAFGLERASGVFAYPTIGAMYWEAAVPLLMVAPFLRPGSRFSDRGSRMGVGVVMGGSVFLLWAILASATRSGLAGVAVSCGLFLWFGRRLGPSVRRPVFGVIAVLVASSSLALVAEGGPDSLLGQRLRWWDDGRWFRVEYVSIGVAPRTVSIGGIFQVPLVLRNTGALTWRAGEPRPFRLAYHWEPVSRPASIGDFEGIRTGLPMDVRPGRETSLVATVRAPKIEGAYHLRWDVVQESVTWFSERGNTMPEQSLSVEGVSDVALADIPRAIAPPSPPPRTRLWRAAIALWQQSPLLGVGPDNFRRRYEAVLSPSPTGQPYSDTRLHANNLYLETLADLGLSGIVVLVAIGFALLGALREHLAAGRLAGIGCAVGASLFFVHGILDYFFEFTPLFGLFWVLLGLTAAARRASPAEGQRSSQG